MSVICSACGQENRTGARFCDGCGSPLAGRGAEREYRPPAPLAERMRREGAALEGERKHVTVLFADVSGSMDLAEQVDPESWRRIMDRFFVLLCDGVHRYEGTVVQFTGDGVMALFGAPIAHEDHAERAAHAALALLRELSRHAAALRREEGLNFSVRLGLNSGEVVAGGIGEDLRVDFTAIGHTVGLAKRMESLAEPGKVYLTEHTAALVDGFFALRDLGSFDVKGVREPVHVFELAGTGPLRSRLERSRERGFSRFVGRERELDVLENGLEDALRGEGRVIGVVGEPGVGKSRLCHEFAERVAARGVAVFRAAGMAHARSVPFHAALDMLRGYFGIDDRMPAQDARERVAGRLLLLDEAFGDKLALVFEFLGIADPERPAPRMDPDARMQHLMAAARELVHRHADREAAVNLVEDLHWVDAPSLAFLDALVHAVPGHRSLVVVNFRPEFTADWMRIPVYRQLELRPLGAEAAGELLRDLLGDHPSLDGVGDEIRRRTRGNPFFVEELVEALVEDGTLSGPRGARVLSRPLRPVTVPASVQSVLAARIDRLPEAEKAALQAAAVLGREFDEGVLARVVGVPVEDLGPRLAALLAGGFMLDREGDLAFRHPLTQEVAYGSLLAERRRRLHAAAARAMAELDVHRLDERAALIAHHWEAASELLEAARWHARAAMWAGTRDALHAAEHWSAVRALCEQLPPDPEAAGLALSACLWTLQFSWRLGMDDAETDAVYAEAQRLGGVLGDEGAVALATGAWATTVGMTRDMSLVLEPVARAQAAVREAGRHHVEVPLLAVQSYALTVTGDLAGSLRALDRGIELTGGDRTLGAGLAVLDPLSWFHMLKGFVTALSGDARTAVALLDRSIELAGASGDLETQGWAHMSYTAPAFNGWEPQGIDEHALRSVEIAEAIGSPFSRIWARYNLGVAHVVFERWDDGLEALEETLELIGRHGTARECEPWALAVRSLAQTGLGRGAEALATAGRALELGRLRGVSSARPAIHLALARALVCEQGAGAAEPARRELELGLELATAMGARGFHPRLLAAAADVLELAGDVEAAAAERERARVLAERVGATALMRQIDAVWPPAGRPG